MRILGTHLRTMANIHPQAAIHRSSLVNREAFWLHAARAIDWIKFPTKAYGATKSSKDGAWFPDGTLNTCYNALDRHVKAGRGDKIAFRHVSVLEPARRRPYREITYSQVLEEVQLLAGVLTDRFGVKKGDRVIVYMPMIIETAVAMLACARIGAIHSTVFGGFAAKELAKRIDDAKPVVILAASCGLEPKGVIPYKEIVDKSLEFTKSGDPKPKLLLFEREGIEGHTTPSLSADRGEYSWKQECERIRRQKKHHKECAEVESDFPLYVLYTSGTTGMPKGVQRPNGGHAVASLYSIENTFGLTRDDTIFCASDFGWVVGHSYTLYCPLLLGCTSIVFEGKPVLPNAGIFWKVVEDYKVTSIFTAPTALRAVRREDPDGKLMTKHNLKSLRSLFLAGERSEPGIIQHYQRLLDSHAAPEALVVDNWWSTESGSPISGCALYRTFPPARPKPGSAGLLLPGMDVRIVDDDGKEVPAGQMGNIVVAKPLPPSALSTVWNNPARFQEAYFERFADKGGFFDTGDAGVMDEEGYISVLSRADDIINVAGHRLGTSLLEQVVASHDSVAEACVVGLPDELKGHVPFALLTLAAGKDPKNVDFDAMLLEINGHLRSDVGSVATLGGLAVSRLPKTRSGKTLRRTVKTLVENASEGKFDAEAPFPPTIEDATAVDDARASVNEWMKAKQKKRQQTDKTNLKAKL